MFRLSNAFCMAYDSTKAKTYLRLPYPKVSGVSVDERGTLAELYANINADIEAALPNVSDSHLKTPKYHFNRRRSEEHTSELQSRQYLVCRLLLEKKKKLTNYTFPHNNN